jgi:hypothetical protein
MGLEIRWRPDVCSCSILQDRHEPEQEYEFESKCGLHESMNDSDARDSIIQLCVLKSQEES